MHVDKERFKICLMNKTMSELLNLKGKTAIVTGGAMGIGLGIVRRLSEAGASVLICDRDEAAAVKAAMDIKEMGLSAAAIKTDVSSEEDIRTAVNEAGKLFG